MTVYDRNARTSGRDHSGNARRRFGWRKLRGEPQAAELDWIGRQLGRRYDEVLAEPLPEQFAQLLTRLEVRQGSRR